MLLLTLFCWMFTAIVWSIYGMAVAITKRFNIEETTLFFAGLVTFIAGLIPVFCE